jgi:VCBS repeat-containing protein
MKATLAVGGFLSKVPRLTPAKVVALLAAMLGGVVALGLAAPAASAVTFSNEEEITINDGSGDCIAGIGKATPYPSTIAVSGLGASVTDVNVSVSGLSHPFPDDVGLLLVSPANDRSILMADTGGGSGVSDFDLTFDDDDVGADHIPDDGPLTNGATYLPTRGLTTFGCAAPRSFPPPAPFALNFYPTTLGVFNSENPNGTWQLYAIDDSSGDVGSIDGWSLDISPDTADTTAPSVTINQASGQAENTSTSPIHFTAVFDEPVSGFTGSDVTLSGTAGSTTAEVTGGPTTYDVAVSGMTSDGTVIASIPANAAQDFALNGNTASTSTDNTVTFIPNTAPTAENESFITNEDTPRIVGEPGVLANDRDVDGDALTAELVSTTSNGDLTLNNDGSFTYDPDDDFNGSDSFTYKANDGTADSTPATVIITVASVNDAPSFTKGANQTVNMNAGAQSVSGWATNISAGPSDESGQAVSFTATTADTSLFTAAGLPAISSDGTLTYTPAPNASGSATVSVTLMDNGGTTNGGKDTSAAQPFTINVTAPTKGQCKKGGWRAFGFPDQGTCITFVNENRP